jgi:hypothetical protein
MRQGKIGRNCKIQARNLVTRALKVNNPLDTHILSAMFGKREELKGEIEDGVEFWGVEENGVLLSVMGIQDKGEVDLIRHAYMRTDQRRKGIGRQLLEFLESQTKNPFLSVHGKMRSGLSTFIAGMDIGSRPPQRKPCSCTGSGISLSVRLKPRWFWQVRSGPMDSRLQQQL